MHPTPLKMGHLLVGFKKAFKGGILYPRPHSGSFSGRFGSDSVGLSGCNSDFGSVTPTFGLELRLLGCNPNHSTENAPPNHFRGGSTATPLRYFRDTCAIQNDSELCDSLSKRHCTTLGGISNSASMQGE